MSRMDRDVECMKCKVCKSLFTEMEIAAALYEIGYDTISINECKYQTNEPIKKLIR